MLLLPCPFCGLRDESEFAFGGPVRASRDSAAQASDADWVTWLTVAPNPKGPVREKWQHARGCGAWAIIERDTVTHSITSGADDHA